MKKTLSAALITMSIVSLLGNTVYASSLPAHTDKESVAGNNGFLPEHNAEEKIVSEVPNPANYFGEGTFDMKEYVYNGKTYEVWYYPQDGNWGEHVTAWFKECEKAGFEQEIRDIEGKTAYVIIAGEMDALLIPGYSGDILFMLEDGLTLSEADPYKPDEIKKGEIRLTINNKTYTFSGEDFDLDEYMPRYKCTAFDEKYIKLCDVSIPSRCVTGDVYYISKGDLGDDCIELYFDGTKYVDVDSYAPTALFMSSDDYYELTIKYADETCVKGSAKGTFQNGETVIELEFYLDK